MKQTENKWVKASLIVCTTLMLTMPAAYRVFANDEGTIWYLLGCVIASFTVSMLLVTIRKWWVFCLLMVVLMFTAGVESFVIYVYKDFLKSANLLSMFTTTKKESSNFVANNGNNLLVCVPILLLAIASLVLKLKTTFSIKKMLKPWGALLVVAILLLPGFKALIYNPPFNAFYQGGLALWQTAKKHYLMPEAEDMTFGAKRPAYEGREVYVMGVGESVRYDHTSFSGYERNTTPLLAANPNLVSYSDYYSTATLTLYSVPMMMSRATSTDFNINFTEKSIVEPYRECGFKTFVLSTGKLLTYEPYLSRGCDSIINVPSDKDMPHVIDSLSAIYPKTFFIVQMMQCHSYYGNWTKEFDKFHPNLISDPQVDSDQLYNNAYDNAVLYSDYIMSEIIKTIDKPGQQAAFMYASDHGEILGMHGHRRGNSLTPPPDEYHVPFFFWYSDTWASRHEGKKNNVHKNKQQPVNADIMFYTACDMADIELPKKYAKPDWSILSDKFKPHERTLILPDGISILRP